MAFLITWAGPPAATETHLGTQRNVCTKSKRVWEGWVLMRGVSGTCLIVTFLHGVGGLSMKGRPSPRGPPYSRITGHVAAQPATQEAINTLICLRARKCTHGCRQKGRGGARGKAIFAKLVVTVWMSFLRFSAHIHKNNWTFIDLLIYYSCIWIPISFGLGCK